MIECQHTSTQGKKCGRESGHDGLHSRYEHVSDGVDENGIPESSFNVSRWNDSRETFENMEKGEAKPADYDVPELHESIIDSLILDAKSNLRPGQVFEIRGKERPRDGADHFGRNPKTRRQRAEEWGMAWYWTPSKSEMPQGYEYMAMTQEPLFRHTVEQAEENRACGYILIARLTA